LSAIIVSFVSVLYVAISLAVELLLLLPYLFHYRKPSELFVH